MNDKDRSQRRSDEIRRRRSQRSRTVAGQTKRRKRKTTTRKQPPVMARDPLVSEMLGAKTRTLKSARQVKRRYDVVLNKQGAEMRLPSLPRIRFGWRLASLSLAAFLVAILYQFWTSPNYQVQSAEVYGVQHLAASDINAVLDIHGRPIFELEPQKMESVLQDKFPEILSVAVDVELPQTVVVTVTERIPVLTWAQQDEVMLVDEIGWAWTNNSRDNMSDLVDVVIEAQDDPPPLPPSNEPIPLSVLLNPEEETEEEHEVEEVSLYEVAQPFLSPEMVEAIVYLFEQKPQDAVLTYDKSHGLGWKDASDLLVYFGDDKDISMKIIVYQAILDHLIAENTTPFMISVENVHAPYYRLEP